uniref:NADH-ubiquinone oxidoreductase chain 4 n=1 Tax=Notocrater youngi TaxID=2813390 RepID=A0A894K7G6_9VEST|nr:NADH dehydrogenase subunit 4 [Notocrater youngi]
MLSILLLNLLMLISFKPFTSWYFRLWTMALGSILSLLLISLSSSTLTIPFINQWMMLDTMSTMLISLTWWISFLSIMASQLNTKSTSNNTSMFSLCIVVLNLLLILTFSVSSSIWFYVFFEASLIPTLFLILGWGYQPERIQAGTYMILYTVSASLPLLILIIIMISSYGSDILLLPNLLGTKISIVQIDLLKPIILIVALGAFLVKLPMFSLHLWLPKAHVEAPVAGSMILAGVLLKLGGYGMIRMHQFIMLMESSTIKTIILSFALYGGVVTSFMCFRQVDLKSLIAYSSVGHMSLVLAGTFSNTIWGWQAALSMMLAHALCSSAMFAMANYNYEKTQTRSMILSKGMLMVSPIMSLFWFLFCVINMASPPSINLLSEIMVFPPILSSYSFLFLPLMLMSFLAAVYNLFLYTSTQHGGWPKSLLPTLPMSSPNMLLILLHYVPVNLLIMKTDTICNWIS